MDSSEFTFTEPSIQEVKESDSEIEISQFDIGNNPVS